MSYNRIVVRADDKSIVILDHEREWVFVADPEGRMALTHTPEASYKRSRYDRWFRVVREPWPGLDSIETEEIRQLAQGWSATWERALQCAPEHARPPLQNWLTRFFEFHAADARSFASLIPGIPILPPDAYQALYLRIQEGCPWNRCAFCSFYKEDRYRVLPLADLRHHAGGLRGYWRNSLRSRHGIFLGDANAIAIPAGQLMERLTLLRHLFPETELHEFYSFVDFFSGGYRSLEELRYLHQSGLKRISLGVESGNAQLMEIINKPLQEEALRHIVDNAHGAGVLINLIFLIGLGGENFRVAHRNSSLELITRLGGGFRVYLSPLVINEDQPYSEIVQSEHWRSMDDAALRDELILWETVLRGLPNVQVSPYHIRQFLY